MSPLQLKIIFNACKIRLSRGEDLTDIIDSYDKLTPQEKQMLHNELTKYLEGENK